MSEIILKFTLPEEREEADIHLKAGAMSCAVYEFTNWLRAINKHGPETIEVEKVWDRWWECLNERGVSPYD